MRRIAIGVFVLYVFAVTWPGATLFREASPRIFGLPLSMAWPILWILIGWLTLLALYHLEHRDRRK